MPHQPCLWGYKGSPQPHSQPPFPGPFISSAEAFLLRPLCPLSIYTQGYQLMVELQEHLSCSRSWTATASGVFSCWASQEGVSVSPEELFEPHRLTESSDPGKQPFKASSGTSTQPEALGICSLWFILSNSILMPENSHISFDDWYFRLQDEEHDLIGFTIFPAVDPRCSVIMRRKELGFCIICFLNGALSRV